jgi:transcription elongation factor Elf1
MLMFCLFQSNLILHKATHNVDDPRCPECNKKFSRIASLKAHVMLHEKEENLFCSECGDEFSTMVCTLFLPLFQWRHQDFVTIFFLLSEKI